MIMVLSFFTLMVYLTVSQKDWSNIFLISFTALAIAMIIIYLIFMIKIMILGIRVESIYVRENEKN